MNKTHAIATMFGSIAVVASGILATSALADGHPSARRAPTVQASYVEPSSEHIPDGNYLGYIRTTGLRDTVAVDFVSLAHGVVRNARPELLVDAGVLANIDFFDQFERPYRMVIQGGTIVEVDSADELLDGMIARLQFR